MRSYSSYSFNWRWRLNKRNMKQKELGCVNAHQSFIIQTPLMEWYPKFEKENEGHFLSLCFSGNRCSSSTIKSSVTWWRRSTEELSLCWYKIMRTLSFTHINRYNSLLKMKDLWLLAFAWENLSFGTSGWGVCEARWCHGSHFSWETWRENGQSSPLCNVSLCYIIQHCMLH